MGCCKPADDEKVDSFKNAKQNGKNIQDGPVQNRRCTDIICLIIFIVALCGYWMISFVGIAGGDVTKLYKPRDYSGAYCGAQENWNSGPNLESAPKLSYMMNVSHTVSDMAKQLMCSTFAKDKMAAMASSGTITSDQYQTYLCDCCLSQCAKCTGSLEVGGDLTTGVNLKTTITNRITALTTNYNDLFNPSGANINLFSDVWKNVTSYMIMVCVDSCDTNYESTTDRTYEWQPSGDDPLRTTWASLKTYGGTEIGEAMSAFTFQALPLSKCPYTDPAYCVPFPGVTFKDMDIGDACELEVASSVAAVAGEAAAEVYKQLGDSALADASSESIGDLAGQLMESMLATVLVAITSFVVGFVLLVLLRFFVGCCVWVSIIMVLFQFLFAGAFVWVYSVSCSGSSLLDTGTAIAAETQSVATATVSVATTGSGFSESMTGDGADYTGRQTVTKDGKTCQAWGTQAPHLGAASYTAAAYPSSNLEANYCRNPYNAGDVSKASTIWCFTTDTQQTWAECQPIGAIFDGDCEEGYNVSSEEVRTALKVLAVIIWVLGGLFLLLVICKCGALRDAIAVNKTGALFMMDTPLIWLVPCVQVLISFVWLLIWIPLAGFLLSQVPDGYSPTTSFATWGEAAGTADTPGKCTDVWPTGFAWKNEASASCTDDGKCWQCAPPRYVIDVRVAYAVFMLLWNNAFFIACGQCIVAGSVCVWFFTPNKDKGTKPCIRQAIKNTLFYHLGSLAFGSFILAVVQFLQLVCYYLEKQATAQRNMVMQMIARAIGCCLWCLEKSVKFLNRQAYIQVALMGTNFCTSAWNAFNLVLRNAVTFMFVTTLTNVIYVIGWVMVTAASGVLGFFILRGLYPDVNPVFPVLIYVAIGYIVGKLLMNIFTLAVDTSLQCLIAAREMEVAGLEEVVPAPLKSRINFKD